MMASLQQAMQKGMPPDQAIQYVKSMATQGIAPLADLYAMMKQFERLKQQQVRPPQTPPTIRDQLNMMEQMQAQGGMPQQMPGGGPQMPQGGPPQGMPPQMPQQMPPQMAQGLGSMNAGAMENPSFAGGGIVAFQEGGPAEVDFSNMTDEQLAMLYEDKSVAVETRRAALGERLKRSGYTSPKELFGRYVDAVKAGIPTGPAIKFDMSGGAPEYMKDEQGRIRTPGMGGPVAYSLTEGIVPMQRPEAVAEQSAVPTDTTTNPYASPQAAGVAFDRQLNQAQQGVRQEIPPARPRTDTGTATTASSRGGDRYAELRKSVEGRKFEEIADTFSPEEEKRINKALSGLTAEKKDAVRMALAEAGFRMAAAASRPGATTLGALSEGAIGGMQQYRINQKELRQTEKELSREMADLRKYQDQVARGERTANREFEEKKQRDLLQLDMQAEQLRQFNAELAQRREIAQLQYAGEGSAGTARNRALDVNIINAQLEDARNELQNLRFAAPTGVKPNSPEHTALIQTAQKRVNDLNRQLSGMLSGASGVPTTGSTNPYSNMSSEEFKATLRKELGI
jgi:hypothetical protein